MVDRLRYVLGREERGEGRTGGGGDMKMGNGSGVSVGGSEEGERGGAVMAAAPGLCGGEDGREEGDQEFMPADARRGERGGVVVVTALGLCGGEDGKEEGDREFTPADARRGRGEERWWRRRSFLWRRRRQGENDSLDRELRDRERERRGHTL
ncbi:hypothetical protein GUJ93_ZPchr0005g15741 [Zizania palustris]|uniref:Uncharacterized protein n=1 Tax=Zizania palustris TaxID=103762 RepID=A0A8J5W0R2_ZIZPA|nr:hypothetical protein GUJ93_ZPchr0005g15741 [Zizania palustris]